MTPRVREVLSWYGGDHTGGVTRLAQVLNYGHLKGTGKLMLLTVPDQAEPAKNYARNPDAYDPYYAYSLAVESGCSGIVATQGFIESVGREFAGEVPLVMQVSGVAGVERAVQLGASAVAVTLGGDFREIEDLKVVAQNWGVPVVAWTDSSHETALNQVSDRSHAACLWGAHVVVAQAPSGEITDSGTQKVLAQQSVRVNKLFDRVKHVMECSFNGRRVVLFESPEMNLDDSEVLELTKELASGGAFGMTLHKSIFALPREEALSRIQMMTQVFKG